MTGWELPKEAVIGGKTYGIHTDFREIIEIFACLQNEDLPEFLRWRIALNLFYDGEISDEDFAEAAEYFRWFIHCGQPEQKDPGPVLLDWETDAQIIVADVNKVAGREIREAKHLHWWTFYGLFQSIGEGNLSLLVGIRDKLNRGKKLEQHEKEYYRRNKDRVKLRKKYSASELAEQEQLQKLLG